MSTTSTDDLASQAESLLESGRIPEAQALYERITSLDPDHADAWFMLGVIHGDTGRPDAGIRCLERALQLDNEAPDTHLNLGNLLIQRGDTKAAEEHLRQAIALDPEYPEAWMLLGNTHASIGQYNDAVRCFEKTVSLWPVALDARMSLVNALLASGRLEESVAQFRLLIKEHPQNPEVLSAFGDTLQRMRRSGEAEMVYRQLAAIAPRDVRGHNGVAEACLSQSKLREAEEAVIAVLQLNADNVQALANLGSILQAKGNIDGARAFLKKAVSLAPDNAAVQYKYSGVLLASGDAESAKVHCRKAIELNPDFVEGQSALASIYEQEGEFDQAWDILQTLTDNGNRSPHVLIAYASLAHHYDQLSRSIGFLEELVASNQLPKVTLTQVYHQLGDLYDRAKDYDRAFLNHQQSNRLKENSFDPQAHTDHISSIINTFDRNFLSTGARASNQSELPVFIIGMPRSGTTLVEQILASHPEVHGAGELLDIISIPSSLGKGNGAGYPECLHNISAARLDEIANGYLSKLQAMDARAIRITDKMPHNFLHLGLIQMLFPSAHVIHTTRNPLDICISIYFQEFSSMHSYAYDLDHLAAYYQEYERLMRHWEQVIDLPVLKVPYEKLVENQEEWSRRMVDFIGLEWDEQCLRFFENKRLVATPSYDQVRQPVHTRSVERWRRYDQHLGPLKRALNIDDS